MASDARRVIFSRLRSGPYAGRYVVHRSGDAPLRGTEPTRWSRLPYYGHVNRENGETGTGWYAYRPGSGDRSVAMFPTRNEAGEYLIAYGKGC